MPRLISQWRDTAPINHFVIDDVLPNDWAQQIRAAFPRVDDMTLRSSLRERKLVTAQMDKHAPLLEESVYAFQTEGVLARVAKITELAALEPDERLYAGGISLMARGHFLNPHIDNSHDMNRSRYRVLNLLYYVSPDWREQNGGNLELWPGGPTGQPLTLLSKFNRLVVMVTHQYSWHSVSPIASDQPRCCVSNYYFSRQPVGGTPYFHVTSFRGRPEQRLRDVALRVDAAMRAGLRGLFPSGIKKTRHFYERSDSER